MNKEKSIYIFDFDDTIVRVTSKVNIYDKHTDEFIKEMSPSYFLEYYELKPNETAEFVDSDTYKKLPFFKTLREAVEAYGEEAKQHVIICTARYSADGPKTILNNEGIFGIPIAAVGKKEYAGNVKYHARRKKAFVAAVIRKYKPETIFFYDDSYLNLSEVGSLAQRLKTKIVLINSIDNTVVTKHID